MHPHFFFPPPPPPVDMPSTYKPRARTGLLDRPGFAGVALLEDDKRISPSSTWGVPRRLSLIPLPANPPRDGVQHRGHHALGINPNYVPGPDPPLGQHPSRHFAMVELDQSPVWSPHRDVRGLPLPLSEALATDRGMHVTRSRPVPGSTGVVLVPASVQQDADAGPGRGGLGPLDALVGLAWMFPRVRAPVGKSSPLAWHIGASLLN